MSYVSEDRVVVGGRTGTIIGWTDGAELPIIFDDEPWTIVYMTAEELKGE